VIEQLQAILVALAAGGATCGGVYALTNAGPIVRWLVAKAKGLAPSTTPAPGGELEQALAVIHAVKVLAVDRPAEVREALLAECDKFESTLRGAFTSEAPTP
jgi:hypothetical protein